MDMLILDMHKVFNRFMTHCATYSVDDIIWVDAIANQENNITQSSAGESLTPDEVKYITLTKKCPDCFTGTLLNGPRGGMSVNCSCTDCGSQFNLGFMLRDDSDTVTISLAFCTRQ